MVKTGVLLFGDFTAKSGRKTPYFINAGRYRTGSQLRTLAGFYADAIEHHLGLDFDVLFGPAYKGIPLAVATAMSLSERGHDVGFCFNRKEVKDHGEGGALIGQELRDGSRVVIIEDVTTAGTSIRETVPLLRRGRDVILKGLVVSVDRQERGTGSRSALAEVSEEFRFATCAIVTIDEVIAHLREHRIDGQLLLTDALYDRVLAYRAEYGAK
jgi:orotate phosphoribosyltransferase